MIITRIRLHNYRQHADIDQTVEGAVIAVIGRNGSGKSNLLGALQFAFTGEQSKFNKKDLLRWGASEGDVTIEFTHNNVKCVVARNLHNAGASFYYGDKRYNGATAVAEALKVHLGLDKDLCKQAVFVQQAEVDAILFTDPAVRERAFQRLMGIGDAAKIYKTMGEAIAGIELPANYDEQIAQGKARWAEMQQRLQTLQGQLQQMSAQRSQAPSTDEIRQGLAACHATSQAIQRYAAAVTAAAAQAQRLQAAVAALRAIDPIDGMQGMPTLDQLDDALATAAAEQRELAAYNAAKADWERTAAAVLALGTQSCAPEQLRALQQEYEAITDSLNQLLGQHKLHSELYTTLKDTGACSTCPVCGTPVADIGKLKERLRTILEAVNAQGRDLRAKQAQAKAVWAQADTEVATFQREYAVRTRAHADAEQRLQALKPVTGDQAVLAAQIGALTKERSNLLAAVMARTSAQGRVDAETGAAKRADTDLANAVTALLAVGLEPGLDAGDWLGKLANEATRLEQQRDVAAKLDQELAGLNATITELAGQMTMLDKTVATLELKRGNQQALRDAVAVLQRTRDWFNYANGPHMLSTSVLSVMNQEVNRFLEQFSAPFTVEPSDDMLGFRCLFSDGRPMPQDGPPDASMLSGGQKIQLAVAFRFAGYTTFASKLGLLSLDEPTVYLDDANVGRFCDLLQQVKQIAEGYNLQVWIATHERSVMSFVDTVIDLTPDTPNQ